MRADGDREALRLLMIDQDHAVQSCKTARAALAAVLITAPAPLRERLRRLPLRAWSACAFPGPDVLGYYAGAYPAGGSAPGRGEACHMSRKRLSVTAVAVAAAVVPLAIAASASASPGGRNPGAAYHRSLRGATLGRDGGAHTSRTLPPHPKSEIPRVNRRL